MNPSAARAALHLSTMADAVERDGANLTLVHWECGPTHNDGGLWYSSVWRLPGGVLKRAFITSDRAPGDVDVSRVRHIQRTAHSYEEV